MKEIEKLVTAGIPFRFENGQVFLDQAPDKSDTAVYADSMNFEKHNR